MNSRGEKFETGGRRSRRVEPGKLGSYRGSQAAGFTQGKPSWVHKGETRGSLEGRAGLRGTLKTKIANELIIALADVM